MDKITIPNADNINSLLIDEFYKIFSESKEGIYAGSKEQIRLTMQLKLGVFVPATYMDRVLKAFISSKLIINTNETKDIERQIGRRYYKLTAQRLYCTNEDIQDNGKILDSLKITFSDFGDKLSALVLDTDLKKLRELEAAKQLKLKDILLIKTYPSTFKFTDIEFLYDIPRSTILDFIDKLERYNTKAVEENRNKSLELKRKLKAERDGYLDRIYNTQIQLIKKTLELDGIIEVQLLKDISYYERRRTLIGIFKVNSATFKDNKLLLTDNQTYKIIATIYSFDMDSEENTISFIDDNLEYRFTINQSLREDIEFLYYLREKANRLDYM
ncbi:hypothetical protein [Clostridium sp.]|uniref:hypothetical protein n=1 Tax=Clostridium sp. TaxID=1506 RepID=UPI003216C976